ncbi:unnamed protein product [Schistosoma spindalis]|nr:unnamed protein product [Schistosoma spindale]
MKYFIYNVTTDDIFTNSTENMTYSTNPDMYSYLTEITFTTEKYNGSLSELWTNSTTINIVTGKKKRKKICVFLI